MSPQWIEVDDEVMAKVQAQAKPFVDSPNDALRRLLGLRSASEALCARLPATKPPSVPFARVPAGELLPMSEIELAVLRAVSQAGGSAPRAGVKEVVERMLAEKLTPLDRAPIPTGAIRWENRLGFARLRLIERGHLRSDSRRGLWELTDAGIEELGRLEAEAQKPGREASP
ncbi:MAG TPA: winged helix-turn-helix domain-containing protein [Solirubrobacterales bacterium]|nr:winged helix-turn-helix domain-containing protein [Solirubrobacterales bacterium]